MVPWVRHGGGAQVQGSRAVTGLVMGEGAEADTIKAVQAKDLTTGALLSWCATSLRARQHVH